jgi:hypothetical protein
VLVGAGIEYDEATVGVGRARYTVGHPRKLRAAPDASATGGLATPQRASAGWDAAGSRSRYVTSSCACTPRCR